MLQMMQALQVQLQQQQMQALQVQRQQQQLQQQHEQAHQAVRQMQVPGVRGERVGPGKDTDTRSTDAIESAVALMHEQAHQAVRQMQVSGPPASPFSLPHSMRERGGEEVE